jgi:hypothetical protein
MHLLTAPVLVMKFEDGNRFGRWVGGQQPSQAVAAPSNVLAASVRIVGDATPLAACLADRPGALPF